MIIKRRERSEILVMKRSVSLISKKRKRKTLISCLALPKKRSVRKRRKIISCIAIQPTPPPTLHTDIIQEVLLRLPVRTVVKFRLVCKLFAEISSQPGFILAHMKLNSDATSLIMHSKASPTLCVLRGVKRNKVWFPDHKTNTLFSYTVRDLETNCLRAPNIFRRDLPHLEAACDGLLCFRKGENDEMEKDTTKASFIIGNPLTNEWISVSVPEQSRNVLLLGFYFHAPSGKYRLLLQFQNVCEEKPSWFYAVFELGPHTLRPIDNSSPYNPYIHHGAYCGPVFMRGNLHWLGCQGDSRVVSLIVVFDVEKEQFTHIQIPDGCYDSTITQLFEIEGKLCILKLVGKIKYVLVWVLKDYEKCIWIKKEVLAKYLIMDDFILQEQTYSVVTYAYDGKFLFVKPDFNDIMSSDKKLTFYYIALSDFGLTDGFQLLDDNGYKAMQFCKRYRETLASVSMYRHI